MISKSSFSLQGISAISLIVGVVILSIASDLYIKDTLITLPLIVSIVASIVLCDWGIKKIKLFKFTQSIREEGPKTHFKKEGTPTMGGLIIVPIGLLIGLLFSWNYDKNYEVIGVSFLTILYMLIGFLDDWLSYKKNTNKGLSAKYKIVLQILFGLIFLHCAYLQNWISSSISLPMGLNLNLGLLIWPLALFVLLAQSNATNLTDGLDGLASGCAALVFTGLTIQLLLRGNPGDYGLTILSISIAGSWLGFLLKNQHPAQIFMGDTGSLAMGASLSGIALISDNLWAILIMGGVFVAESVSVIIQVWIFKITKKRNGKGIRVFLMAPLHHHYEIKGESETTIVKGFWIATILLICINLFLLPSY